MTDFSIANIQSQYNGTFNGVKSGTISKAGGNSDSFATTISHQDGTATFDSVLTNSKGQTAQQNETIIKNTNGTYTETVQTSVNGKEKNSQIVTTNVDGNSMNVTDQGFAPNGMRATENKTITGNQNGSESVAGTITLANGAVGTLAGTLTQSAGSTTSSDTLTIADGKTATVNNQWERSGNVVTDNRSGTGFNGVSFSDTISRTIS